MRAGMIKQSRKSSASPERSNIVFLSPVKRRLLENVVYVITETERKTAMQIRRRRGYQRLLKVDPLKCILCGGQMRFTGLKRGYRLAELVMMHEPLARQRVYS